MNRTRQKGAVLIVSLILLVIMTFIGLAGMEMTGLEEKMAGNMRDRNMAFQAAEASLLEAEAFLAAQDPVFNNANGLYQLRTDGRNRWDTVDWSNSNDVESYAGNGFSELGADGVAYIIEDFAEGTRNDGEDYDPTDISQPDEFYYRVTARAVGQTNAAEVLLQTIYKK